MVNKDVIRETFMKLESYDRINVISDILRLSNLLELEFYSSVIESILKYHKLSFNTLREELNSENNLKFLISSDCTEPDVRSKLISTISLLKTSNDNGAAVIFDFLKENHSKLKELATSNQNTYDEILLIYQLAIEHPTFNFEHSQEIYDFLTQIRSLSVSRDYFNMNNGYEFVVDLSVLSMNVNDRKQYVYKIKVQWSNSECFIQRTLEDIYNFYEKLYEIFPEEMQNGDICRLYLSYPHNNLELSLDLMSTFFKKFLNSPQMVLRCDYVREFFKPRKTDRQICVCASCQDHLIKFHWCVHELFESVDACQDSIDLPVHDQYSHIFDHKTETPCSSSLNFSVDSKYIGDNSRFDVNLTNQTCSEDGSESPVKLRKKKKRIYHSSGSSPINTPSEDSEILSKHEFPKNHSNRFNRQLSMVIENSNMACSFKDIQTENWLSQSNQTITSADSHDSLDLATNSIDNSNEVYGDDVSDQDFPGFDVSSISHCKIGNLYDWLKHNQLQSHYLSLNQMSFGEFYLLSEQNYGILGLVENTSKQLLAMIRELKRSDIVQIDEDLVNIRVRALSNLPNSVNSVDRGCNSDYLCPQKPGELSLDLSNPSHQYFLTNYGLPCIPNNYIVVPPYFVQRIYIKPLDRI